MGRLLWLADELRAAGLRVVEVSGWQTRGSSDFAPRWQIFHHTASAPGSNAPALGICTHGRSDLPGPLANVLAARDGTMYVIASGRANHAGAGRYPDGGAGNALSVGWECENSGVGEPWPPSQLDAIARGQAAVGKRLGIGPDRVIYHRTFAPGRKIDPAGPGIPDLAEWQARVANAGAPPPLELRKGSKGLAVAVLEAALVRLGHDRVIVDGSFGDRTEAAVIAAVRDLGLTATRPVVVGPWALAGIVAASKRAPRPRNLTRGSVGPRVLRLRSDLRDGFGQTQLTRLGGYGAALQDAVKNAQRFFGEPVTGNATPAFCERVHAWAEMVRARPPAVGVNPGGRP